MMLAQIGIRTAIATVATTIAFFFGGLDSLLKILILLIVLDYISGVLKAIHDKAVSSEIGFKGIVKKVCTLIIVAVAFLIEEATGNSLPLREIVLMFFIANEGISVLENAACMGVPFPDKLRDVLIQIKCKDQGEVKEKEEQDEKELEE